MSSTAIIFWIFIVVIFYSYLGYPLLMFLLVKLKLLFKGNKRPVDENYLPEVTLFIASYNEKDYLQRKIENSFSLNYPKDKLQILFVTDGSDDGSPEILAATDGIRVLHEDKRGGKISAMNRGMQQVTTPIVVFTDCNTDLGVNSIAKIVELFSNPKVGCVSGEKRIFATDKDTASGSGEGIYWRYESALKKLEAELSSTIGAAGELFAIRTELFKEVEKDTLLDDFIISLRVAIAGYTIQYDPEAYAIEDASLNVHEELKRKIRIAAGAVQSVLRLKTLLNPFKHGWLSIQYISHKFLRWMVTPLLLLLVIPLNVVLAFETGPAQSLYQLLLYLQIAFYLTALVGWYFENRKISFKILFVPYYFFIMNLAMYLGLFRYLKGNQSVNWEKSKRKV